MRKLRKILLCASLVWGTFFFPQKANSDTPTVRLKYLAGFGMTSEPVWGPMTPGQISGFAFDPSQKSFFAISDDRFNPDDKKSRGHPRFYRLALPISQNTRTGRWDIRLSDQFQFTYLSSKKGDYIPFERGDGEGIVILPNGNFAIATEGWAEVGRKIAARMIPLAAPSVDEFRRDGRWVRSFPVPGYYRPQFDKQGKQRAGVFRNNGFESLTHFGTTLFTATEGPLVQDGGPATFEKGGFVRILVLQSARNGAYTPRREFAYPVDSIFLPPSWGKEKPEGGENGVSEMIALDENRLLVMERAFLPKPYLRNHIRIYQVDIRGAENTLGRKTLPKEVEPLEKRLILDWCIQKGQKQCENYEAMAFVDLPDGTRGLVLAVDNNHNHPYQRQALLLFRLK